MKTAYLDAFSGLSGDMLVGALLDAGVDFNDLEGALASLPLKGSRLVAPAQDRERNRGGEVRRRGDGAAAGAPSLEILAMIEASCARRRGEAIARARFSRCSPTPKRRSITRRPSRFTSTRSARSIRSSTSWPQRPGASSELGSANCWFLRCRWEPASSARSTASFRCPRRRPAELLAGFHGAHGRRRRPRWSRPPAQRSCARSRRPAPLPMNFEIEHDRLRRGHREFERSAQSCCES